jgi:hypothetical protein
MKLSKQYLFPSDGASEDWIPAGRTYNQSGVTATGIERVIS